MKSKPMICLLILACALLAPAAARADDFSPKTLCVSHSFPGAVAGCDSVWEFSATGLGLALNYANSVTTYRGDDTIKLDAGTIAIDQAEEIALNAQLGFGALHLKGAGVGQTTITGTPTPAGVFTALRFDFANAPSSSVKDLTIDVGSQITSWTGLRMAGGMVENVKFKVIGGSESSHIGLFAEGAAVAVKESRFDVIGYPAYGVFSNAADLAVSDAVLESTSKAFLDPSVGVRATGNFDGRRLSFWRVQQAIDFSGTRMDLIDTLVNMNGVVGDLSTAVRLRGNPGATSSVKIQGMTLVGSSDGIALPGVSLASATNPVDAIVTDSILDLSGAGAVDASCSSSGGGVGSALRLEHSMHAAPSGGCLGFGSGNLSRGPALQPAYVSAGTGDYRPAPGSPVIDAGDPSSTRIDPKVDRAGAPRFADGNGDGNAVLDMGAFELQAPPAAAPSPLDPALKITLSKPSGKFKLRKRARPFRVVLKKPRPRIKVTSNRRVRVALVLLKPRAGWRASGRCVARKPRRANVKRCDLPIRGKQPVTIGQGVSYLSFGGKWAGRVLRPGRYVLTMKVRGLNEAPRSQLSVIR